MTTGVWTRQVLIDEFGVDNSKITWFVDDEEHVQEMQAPRQRQPRRCGQQSLADMMARGEIVAGFAAAAGIGRTGAPTGGWQEVEADYPDLFPNAEELEADYYRRTGVYPMHGTIVVKDSVLAEHPWVARSLYDAFTQAKDEWVAKLNSGEATGAGADKYRALPEDRRPRSAALRHRGQPRDDRGAGEDRFRSGADPAPHDAWTNCSSIRSRPRR